jgi:hypothetical protein
MRADAPTAGFLAVVPLHQLIGPSADHADDAELGQIRTKPGPESADVKLLARQADGFLYLITVRQSPTASGPVRFSGLPPGIKFGAAMFEYDGKDFRTFRVTNGAFTDPFAPHDARVYRFKL